MQATFELVDVILRHKNTPDMVNVIHHTIQDLNKLEPSEEVDDRLRKLREKLNEVMSSPWCEACG